MEEFGDEEREPTEARTQVFDLDEDGIDSLEQFGMVKQVV